MIAIDMQVKALEKILNEDDPAVDPEQVKKTLAVYKAIQGFDQSDLYILFDSGLFNDIVQSYTEQALIQCGLADKVDEVRQELSRLFDTVGSAEVRG